MSISTTKQVVETLQEKREALYGEYAGCEERYQQTKSHYEEQIAKLESAITLLDRETSPVEVGMMDRAPAPLSVGHEKMGIVRDALKRRGTVRQVDLVRLTKLNSGTVSTAVRLMQKSGEAIPHPKAQGSRVWEYVSVLDTAA